MKIVMIGQKWLAVTVAETLTKDEHDLVAVVAPAADRLSGWARDRTVPVVMMEQVPVCDLLIAAHAHIFIPLWARERAVFGCLGYHPSLLPIHRGRDAVRWTIRDRDRITGGTAYWLDDGADTGDIAAQEWCLVRPDDTAETLWRRDLAPMGVRLIQSVVHGLSTGTPQPRTPQPEWAATWEPSLSPPRLAVSENRPLHNA